MTDASALALHPPGARASRPVVARMVAYYDVFRHPLTEAELARLAGGAVEEAVAALEAEGRLERVAGYVCLAGRAGDVERRRARSEAAERRWRAARAATAVLARFPFVRGIFVTGGLSKQSCPPDGDVDFLLIVEPGAVWTTKTALQGLRRPLPERARDWFCTNYLLAADHPVVDDRNAFTAMELATAVPMWGRGACVGFLEANRWAERYVPGLAWNVERARRAPPGRVAPLARAVEGALGPVQGAVEGRARAAWDRFWNRKYAWLDDEVRAQRFKRRAEVSTNHLHDFQDYVLAEYRGRLDALGVAPP